MDEPGFPIGPSAEFPVGTNIPFCPISNNILGRKWETGGRAQGVPPIRFANAYCPFKNSCW